MANTVTGNTGKQYTYNNDGSITVNRPDGSSSTVRQGDATWNATNSAIAADTKQPASTISTSSASTTSYNGGTTVPYYTNSDGSKYYETTRSDGSTYKTGAYSDNQVYQDWAADQWAQKNQAYADIQAAKRAGQDTTAMENNYNKTWGNADISVNGFVNNAYNSYNNADELNKYLASAGMSDFDTNNATLTAGRNILPGGSASQYQSTHVGADGSNSDNSLWLTYGGRDYLIGGDSANYAQYANGKTDNLVYLPDGQTNAYGGTVALDANGNAIHQNGWDNRDYLLGNLLNNPYIQNDPNLYNSVQQNMSYYNTGDNYPASGSGSSGAISTNPNGYYTGNENVDRTISSINNMIDFAITTGDSDLYNSIKELLDNGLNTTQEWIASQKSQAEANAEKQARSARVNQLLQQQAMNEAYSSAGIGTTGAVQSGMQAINDSYGRSLGDINNNLASLLGNLNDQELKALGDYYQNLGQYKYNITNDDLNRQYQLAQMEQSQQQFNANMAMQQQELAWKQQQAEADRQWQEKVYNDSLEQSRLAAEADAYQQQYDANISQRDYALKAIQAGYTSPELAAALGIPYNEALALAQQYAAKNTYYKGSTSSGGGGNPSSDLIGPDEGIYTQNPIYAPGYYVNSTDLNQQYQNGILPLDQNGMPITQASLMAGLYDPLTRR